MTQSVELAEGGKNVQFTDRQVPWMKLGNITEGALTANEAAKAGGLNFTVSLRNVYFTCDEGQDGGENTAPDCLRKMTNRRIVVRDDTLEPLSIVSDGYPVLQYPEAFDFMDSAVAKFTDEGAKYVAAGALKGGKQGFMVVRLPESLQINVLDGGDPHEMFAVLRTSMDLTRAVEVMMMPLRGLCMNQLTLTSFSAGVPNRWAVRHTSTMKDKLIDAQASMGKMDAYVKRYNEIVKRLAGIKLNDEKAKLILGRAFAKMQMKGKEQLIDALLEKRKNSPLVGYSDSGWGLVNAVSDHFDWRAGGTPESKFLNALQGPTHKYINLVTTHILRTHTS
jgi:phage/plasmid-like protein (TIGR03299 family)